MYGTSLKNFKGLLLTLLFACVFIDIFWLLPKLDERAIRILSGKNLMPSYFHFLYIIIECIKFIALITLGYLNIKSIGNETRH